MITDRNYLNRDYASIRASIIRYYKSLAADWTSFNADNFESHLIDIIAGVADMLSFYIDTSIKESNLLTAQNSESVVNLSRAFGYKVNVAAPARGSITFSSVGGNIPGKRFIIPANTRFTLFDNAGNPYSFYTTQFTSFEYSPQSFSIPLFQGEKHTVHISYTTLQQDFKVLLANDRNTFDIQGREINTDKVVLDNITVRGFNGTNSISFTECEDAFLEVNGGPKFSVHRRGNGDIYLMFTHDWKEYIKSDLLVTYYTTNGELSNIKPQQKFSMQYSVHNPLTGGDDTHYVVYDEDNVNILNYYDFDISLITGGFIDVDYRREAANALNHFKTYDRIVSRSDLSGALSGLGASDYLICDWSDFKNITKYETNWAYAINNTSSSHTVFHSSADLQSLALDPSRVVVYVYNTDDGSDGSYSAQQLSDWQNNLNSRLVFTSSCSVINALPVSKVLRINITPLRSQAYQKQDIADFFAALRGLLYNKSGFNGSLFEEDVKEALSSVKKNVSYRIVPRPDDWEEYKDTKYVDKLYLEDLREGYECNVWEYVTFTDYVKNTLTNHKEDLDE